MRVALRIIEERAELVSKMGRDALRTGRTGMGEMYGERAEEYRNYAETLRSAILSGIEKSEEAFGEVIDFGKNAGKKPKVE